MGDVAPLTSAQGRALARLIKAGIVDDRVFPKGLTPSRWRLIRAWFEQAATAELARRAR